MLDLLKRLLKLAIPAAILVVTVNDGGRYLQAQYELGNITRDAANASAEAYRRFGGDRTESWRAGEVLAEKFGATIYGFDIANERAHVWTRMPVTGMWVAPRAIAVIDKKPAETPIVIETDDQALIQ